MSILDNKLTRIGKKLETTKIPQGDFPYKFGTSIFNKLTITFLYALFGGGLAYMTFISNNTLVFANLLGEHKQYSFYIQIVVLLVFTAIYLTHLLANIKISRTEIVFPSFYNFSRKKVAIQEIKRISFIETITVPRNLSLLADIFPRAFSAIEASLYVNNTWVKFKLIGKELKIIRVLQELIPDHINDYFYNLDEEIDEHKN